MAIAPVCVADSQFTSRDRIGYLLEILIKKFEPGYLRTPIRRRTFSFGPAITIRICAVIGGTWREKNLILSFPCFDQIYKHLYKLTWNAADMIMLARLNQVANPTISNSNSPSPDKYAGSAYASAVVPSPTNWKSFDVQVVEGPALISVTIGIRWRARLLLGGVMFMILSF